jgi:FecR protein
MKNKFLTSFAVLALALLGQLTVSAFAQTTDEGAGPSEQPSAPMEVGQPQAPPPPQGGPPQPGQPQGGHPPRPGQPPQMPGEAQPGGPSGEGPAKIDQGVGRISMIHGDVSTQRGDSGTWSAAILNQPVVDGDKVATGTSGRAEVQLDYANILRLSSNAQANLANFTNKYIQIQVGQGLANYSVFGESEAEPEIDTPNVAVHPAHQNGVFRIEVRPDGDSVVIVRKGEAEISTPQGIATLKQGDMATVRGSGADAKYKIAAAPDRDDWDQWNIDRDRMIHTAKGWEHTNKYYVGAEDLDANGRWENVPDYGQVWVPNEPDDWAPYRDGNWTYEPYYGWTWVGYEPWGWAPYHYGRWMWYGGAWAWWPGPVWGPGFYRPFWAPAYVSFFGWGGGWGLGFGFGWGGWGGFGWLPLGPCDRFFPWWGGYGGRFGVVAFDRFGTFNRFGGIAPLHAGTRFSNVAHINDAHISSGVSTVGAGQFGSGRTPAVAATHAQLSSAHMMTGNMPVVPTRASLSASGRAAAPSTIHSTASDHFAGTPTTAHTESFQQQTAHLQQSMQQSHFSPVTAGRSTGSTATESRGTPSTGASANSSKPATGSEPNRGGWKTFTPPSHSSESAGRSENSLGTSNRGESGSYWNRTTPSSSYPRGSSSGYGGYSRPQLNMRQPIVQPRSSDGYGGYRGSPSYGGTRGGYTGGYSGGYSGGSHTAPSSGGGGSHSSGGSGHSGGGGHH